jgi:hypothetical protein
VITLSDAGLGDEGAVAALCTELGESYGSLPGATWITPPWDWRMDPVGIELHRGDCQ